MRTRTPPDEPSVQVLDITQDGDTTVGDSASRTPGWLVIALVVTLAAGLGYGYVLGRGDRPTEAAAQLAPTTITTETTVTTVTVEILTPDPVQFRRALPGHDLGRGVTEYLNPNLFSTITVDERGMVWAGGPTGVVRLDPDTGEFDRLTDSDGTGPLDVHDLAVGPGRSVYAATARGLSHWDGIGWRHDSVLLQEQSEWSPMSDSVPTREIGPLAVAPDGTIWLVSYESSYWETPWSSNWETTSALHHGPMPFSGDVPRIGHDGYIEDLTVAPDRTVWALIGGGVWHYDGAWTEASVPGWASTMALDARGDLLVGREGADIVRIDTGAGGQVVPWGADSGVDSGYGSPDYFIRLMAGGSDGSVWGLAELRGRQSGWEADDRGPQSVLLHIEEGLVAAAMVPDTTSDITDMAVAPNGNVWLVLEDRLSRFDGADWSDFYIEGQPPFRHVDSMAIGPAGDVWLAGDGSITRFASDGWHPDELVSADGDEDRHSEDEAWVHSNGEQVWAGADCRVFEYRAGGWHRLPPLPVEPVECWGSVPTGGLDGSLSLVAMGPWGAGTAYRWNGGEWSTLARGLTAHSMDVGPDGTVWLAGWEGLGQIVDDAWNPLVTGLEFEQVVVAGDGTVWALAQGWDFPGLWRFDDGVWQIEQGEPFGPSSDGLVRALVPHPDGSVWGLERRGDQRLAARSSEGLYRLIGETGELDTMAIGLDGTIWVAGEGRLYRVDPIDLSGTDDLQLTPLDWRIELDDAGPGVHTIHMDVEVLGLTPNRIASTSGRLIWNETAVELCRIDVDLDNGLVGVGDTFQTTEGCGANRTAMQDAFDEFEMPETACVFIEVDDGEQPLFYCAPLVPDQTP